MVNTTTVIRILARKYREAGTWKDRCEVIKRERRVMEFLDRRKERTM